MKTKLSALRKAFWLLPSVLPFLTGSAQAQAIANILQPTDPIIANSTNSPSGLGVANAIDGTEAKYLNFDGATGPCGFIVTPAVGPTLIAGLAMQSANDSGPPANAVGTDDRDPKIVTIEGNNDSNAAASWDASTNWVLLYTNSNFTPFTNRFEWEMNYFTNTGQAFSSYRWTCWQTQGTTENSMQIAEVQLLGRMAPSNLLLPTDKIIANSTNSEGVANAIDGTEASYLNFDGATGPCGFIITPGSATVAQGIAMQDVSPPRNAGDTEDRNPKIVTIEASNDTNAPISWDSSTNWTLIYTNHNFTPFTNWYQWESNYFINEAPFLYYRWTCWQTQGTTANGMLISEVRILGLNAPANILVPADPIIASSTNSPSADGVANAIDSTEAKYLNFDGATGPCGFIVTPTVGATTINGIGMQSANDSGPPANPVGTDDRDPKVVTIEGSNDPLAGNSWDATTNWTLIYTNSDFTPFTNRFEWEYDYFYNVQPFTSYRWTCWQTQGTTANSMQISEVQLLAITSADCALARFTLMPLNTPVLEGQPATFYTAVNGSWPIQWYSNGAPITGATKTSFTTSPVTTNNATNLYSVGIVGCVSSPQVFAQIFTPSTNLSIGVHFQGGGANGAPSALSPEMIAGQQLQAFWNECTNGNGGTGTGDHISMGTNLVDSTGRYSPITFSFANTGAWGAGTGTTLPDQILMNGIAGQPYIVPNPMTFTFGNIPTNTTTAVLVYSVSQEYQEQSLSFQIQTNTPPVYEETFDADTYATAPGFYRVTSTNVDKPAPGDLVRFDGVTPDSSGNITVSVNILSIPASTRNVGVNAIQLLLNPPNPGNPPTIVEQPQPAVALSNGVVRLSVDAVGNGLSYQWRYNGVALLNAAPYSGVDTATLVISPFTAAQQGEYTVAIFNAAGYVVSEIATASVSDFQITNGLVAEWLFNETSGTNAPNLVAGGAPAWIQGTAAWAPGVISNGLVLDGSTTWGFVSNFSPTASTAISGAAWVNVNISNYSVGTNAIIFRNMQDVFNGPIDLIGQFSLELDANTNGTLGLVPTAYIGLYACCSQINYAVVSAPNYQITNSGWHHVAFTADGAQLRLYVDGADVSDINYNRDTGGTPLSPLNQPWISIGVMCVSDPTITPPVDIDTYYGPSYLPGELDDMALWNRAITAEEVRGIYQRGLEGLPLSFVVEQPAEVTPILTVTHLASDFMISWSPLGGALQSSAALGFGAIWSTLTTNNPAILPIGAGTSFFRVAQ